MNIRTARFISPIRSLSTISRFENFVFDHIDSRPGSLEEAREALPVPHPLNATLTSWEELEEAYRRLRRLGLRQQYDSPLKVWDGLRFLSFILNRLDPDAAILDLGSGPHSNLLYWLGLYGYTRLWACDVIFAKPVIRGPVHYVGADMVHTRFPDGSFDCVIAQSSIEHGVDPDEFLREAGRLCRPRGYLLLSTDYWPEKVDTHDVTIYGVPWTVYSRDELEQFGALARRRGFYLVDPPDLHVGPRLVRNKSKHFTFVFLAFEKSDAGVDPGEGNRGGSRDVTSRGHPQISQVNPPP